MNLSPNFTLEEFTASRRAMDLGIDNTPPDSLIPHLIKTACGMEEVRTVLGNNPIHVNSGYRCPTLNQAIGSKSTSQHLSGSAVDFICPLFGSPTQIVQRIVCSEIEYDQVILETAAGGARWVHISFSDRNRKQALIIDPTGTRSFV